MNLRLFVALDPPEPVRRRIATMQSDLRRAAGRHADEVRWASPGNVHLTLQFLGAVPEERLEMLRGALAAVAAAARPLALEVKGAGGFPSARRPRVVWVGVGGEVEALAALAAELGRSLAPLGFPPDDRPLSPHLTLGRAREGRGASGLGGALAQVAGMEGAPWRADALLLYRSHLSPSGARYEPLDRFPLGGA
jgi:2'-5' RNA ligase